MKTSLIRVSFEESISREIYKALEGEMVEIIIKEAKIEKIENEWKYILEGHSFKVSSELSPGIHLVFQEVIDNLEFNEPVELYISNSANSNAFSLYRQEEDHPHIINIESSLIERLDDDELRFVIGHEIGHLINKAASIWKLIQFVYPDPNGIPLILGNKINLWRKLSELTADRYGFIACPKLDKVLSCFFKIASGLGMQRISFNSDAFLKEMEQKVKFFEETSGMNNMTHPVNPIRVKAIEAFSKSDLYIQMISNKDVAEDKLLDAEMTRLVRLLLIMGGSELDMHRKHFIAAAGLIISQLDKDVVKEEFERLLNSLSSFTIFPKEFLTDIISEGNAEMIFMKSIHEILRINPGERFAMMDFMIQLALSDRKIMTEEIGYIYKIGTDLFGLTSKEIAQIIAQNIQKHFLPDVFGV